jgi:hypothetical protein
MKRVAIYGAGLALLTSPVALYAGTGVTTEAIDAYNCGPLSNSVANVTGFRNKLLSTAGFTSGVNWTNTNVFASDFIDVQYQSLRAAGDFSNFDRQNQPDAISYFTGHGVCDDHIAAQPCTTASQCTTPPGAPSRQGICERWTTGGECTYGGRRTLVDFKNSTCGEADYTNFARYGENGGFLTSWATGAGSDGGVNFVVIDSSCGVSPSFWDEQLRNAFAGVHGMGLLMPTTQHGDTANVPDRGSAFGNFYVVNPNSSIGTSWASSLNNIPFNSAFNCQVTNNGGGHGFNGCGANFQISYGNSSTEAVWHRSTETWVDVRNDLNDGQGTQTWAAQWSCNYDCNTFFWAL